MADHDKRSGTAASSQRQGPELEYASGAGLLLRLYWMAFGNLLLLFLAGSIARQAVWSITARDLAYGLTVATLVAARHVDVAKYDGQTVNSEPATRAHVRRYAVALLVLASLAWAAAQSVQI